MVDKHHHSVSHPNVFAAGDVCACTDVTLSRFGIHVVDVGPILAENLLAVLNGGALQPGRPKRRYLQLLACGPPRCGSILEPVFGRRTMGMALEKLD